MTRKEAAAKIRAMLAAGSAKREVFSTLCGQGVKDRVIAWLIASWADPERCRRNRLHVRILVGIMVVQLLLGIVAVNLLFSRNESLSGGFRLVVMASFVLLVLLFIWGFVTNRVGAYHAYIVLSVVQIAEQFAQQLKVSRFAVDDLLGYAIAIALVVYVFFIRNRLFPDFQLFGPRKVNGQYVFVERA